MIDCQTIGVAIGVAGASVVTVIGTAVQNNARINALEKVMDARFAGLDKQIVAIDKRFDSVDRLLERTDARITGIQADLHRFGEENARHDARLYAHAARLDAIERDK